MTSRESPPTMAEEEAWTIKAATKRRTRHGTPISLRRARTSKSTSAPRGLDRPESDPRRRRQCTLTQMDFVNVASADASHELTDMLQETPISCHASKLSTVAHFEGAGGLAYSQRQIHEQRRRSAMPATSKTPLQRAAGASRNVRMEESIVAQRVQPIPRKKRRIQTGDETARTTTRQTGMASEVLRPAMIIQESTGFTENSYTSGKIPFLDLNTVTTPSSKRDRIPSSQTPESIGRSVRRQSTHRQPLCGLSTNLQSSPSRSLMNKKSHAPRTPGKKPPGGDKVCVSKIPSKSLLSRPDETMRERHDIWSLQATSSTKESPSSGTEIGPLNQCQPEPAMGKSGAPITLPDLNKVFTDPPRRKAAFLPSKQSDKSTRNVGLNLPHQAVGDQDEDMLFNPESVNVIPELDQLSSPAPDDLGSPVKNDTQYVHDLCQRISSPSLNRGSDRRTAQPARLSSPPNQLISSAGRGLARKDAAGPPLARSPLPLPRLVSSPCRGPPTTTSASIAPPSKLFSASTSTKHPFERAQVAQVRLNDTTEAFRPSPSSPILPPSLIHQTQKSIHPLSMPHPSQVSTQAPSTQSLFPESTQQATVRTPVHTKPDQITIKDSISCPARLSPYQQHAEINDSDDPNVHRLSPCVNDSEDEEDFDLDPSTYRPQPTSTAKVVTSEAESTHHTVEETTQTPTQTYLLPADGKGNSKSIDESPTILAATTRSQRDANIDVIPLPSSSLPVERGSSRTKTPRHSPTGRCTPKPTVSTPSNEHACSSPPPSSPITETPSPPPLKRKYSPLAGYNNDTQSDFTQGGHVSAAYVHRAHEEGWLPKGYVPRPYRLKKWSGRRKAE